MDRRWCARGSCPWHRRRFPARYSSCPATSSNSRTFPPAWNCRSRPALLLESLLFFCVAYNTYDFGLRFRSFRPILRAALLTVGYAGSIQRAANHVITNAGKILHTAPADQHDRVLLEVVADARNIGRHFDSIGEAHTSHFPERRVRLFGSGGINACTNSALLRTALQSGTRSLP